MKNIKIFLLITIVTFNPLFAQDEKITVDWLFSQASAEITKVPRFYWLNDGTTVIYDTGVPFAERKFEKYNPRTGESKLLFDAEKAKASIDSMLQRPIPFIFWPNAFNDGGTRSFYLMEGDIFVLDFLTSEFSRITKTEEEESSVRFSPDGKKLAYVRSFDLYVFDLGTNKETRLTKDGKEHTTLNGTLSWVYWEEIFGRQDIGYWWSDDSKSIAFFQTDESEVDLIHYVDHRTTVQTLIKQRYPKAGGKNPLVKLGIVNVENADKVWADLSSDNYEYIVRVKWLPDSKLVSLQTNPRNQNCMDLWFVDAGTGKAKHILTEKDEAWVNIHDDLYFIDDGEKFTWASERTGYNHLYLYSKDGELINQLTSGEWACKPSSGAPFAGGAICAINEEEEYIYFTSQKESSVQKQLYRVDFDGDELVRLSEGDGTHRVSFSWDAKMYFDSYSSLTIPTNLSLYESNGHVIKKFTEPRLDLVDSNNLVIPELTTIAAKDGFPLPATIYKPKDFDPNKKYPVILFVYGGPSAPQVQDSWSFWMYLNNIFVSEGYIVTSVDNRSATGASKILENSVHKEVLGDKELNDILDAVGWFKEQSWVDGDRIGIWGWSGGGTFTINALTHSTEFKAGIAVASTVDWKYYDTKFGEQMMGTPEENPEGYATTSFLKDAKNLSGKLLIVHGSYDDNVHLQQVYAFIDQLIIADKRFELMIYPMRKHGISDFPAFKHLLNTMIDFWQRNL